DPRAARDLAADLHLSVRERLQPHGRVSGGVLGVGGLGHAGRVELDLVGVKRLQRSLIVGVESGYETVGCLFDFWHCVSSKGNVSEAEGPRRLLPSSGRQPRGLHALASVQEQRSLYQKMVAPAC